MSTFTLQCWPAASCCVVSLNLPDTAALRLKALGIFEGQRIELAKRGSPIIVKAAGGRVAIAEEIARRILVRAANE